MGIHSIVPRLPRDASRVAPIRTSSKSKRCMKAQLWVVQMCFASVPEKFVIRRDANATIRAQPRSGHRRGQAESEAQHDRILRTATARVEPVGVAQPNVTTTRYRKIRISESFLPWGKWNGPARIGSKEASLPDASAPYLWSSKSTHRAGQF